MKCQKAKIKQNATKLSHHLQDNNLAVGILFTVTLHSKNSDYFIVLKRTNVWNILCPSMWTLTEILCRHTVFKIQGPRKESWNWGQWSPRFSNVHTQNKFVKEIVGSTFLGWGAESHKVCEILHSVLIIIFPSLEQLWKWLK